MYDLSYQKRIAIVRTTDSSQITLTLFSFPIMDGRSGTVCTTNTVLLILSMSCMVHKKEYKGAQRKQQITGEFPAQGLVVIGEHHIEPRWDYAQGIDTNGSTSHRKFFAGAQTERKTNPLRNRKQDCNNQQIYNHRHLEGLSQCAANVRMITFTTKCTDHRLQGHADCIIDRCRNQSHIEYDAENSNTQLTADLHKQMIADQNRDKLISILRRSSEACPE